MHSHQQRQQETKWQVTIYFKRVLTDEEQQGGHVVQGQSGKFTLRGNNKWNFFPKCRKITKWTVRGGENVLKLIVFCHAGNGFPYSFLKVSNFPIPLQYSRFATVGYVINVKKNLHSCEYSCTVTAPVGGRVTHAWIAWISTFALNVAILSEYWICVHTEYISSLSFFVLHALACVKVAAFTLSKLIYHVPCSIELICGLTAANLDARENNCRCENFPELYKSVHLGSWHLRGLQTGLLTSYFILCLYPIATQTHPYSAIVCLKMWLVRGMEGAGLLSRTFQYLVRSCFFSSSVHIHLHSPFTPVKVSLLM